MLDCIYRYSVSLGISILWNHISLPPPKLDYSLIYTAGSELGDILCAWPHHCDGGHLWEAVMFKFLCRLQC